MASQFAWAQRLADQGWRPGNAIQFFQGDPYWFLGRRARTLQIPVDDSHITENMPTQVNNIPITWIAQTFNNAIANNVVVAQPNRVLLIVQNLSPTNPVAVNFDQGASISGTSPNFVSQGILLLPGVTLFVDKWCPTGTVNVGQQIAATAPSVVVQGYSAIGNIPNIAV